MTASVLIAASPETPAIALPASENERAHREDHTGLLVPFREGTRRPVDAIVVPVGRTAEHLQNAVALALRLDCLLVAMCGADSETGLDDAASVLVECPELKWYAVHVPKHPDELAFAFGFPSADSRWPLNLLSAKRNTGLLLGRMLGWRAVLLLDDDIGDLVPDQVLAAASGLDHHRAVGFTVADWPDNSVVCHANRLGGRAQSVFVSGAALMVDSTSDCTFFPWIYNEDWLFLFHWLRRQAVSALCRVRQADYDPYDKLERPCRQEFGEVIAEGMIELVHRGDPPSDLTDPAYWQDFLERRQRFIERATRNLAGRPEATKAVLDSLDAAELERSMIDADECVRFVSKFEADSVHWRRTLDALPAADDFLDAAKHLGLTAHRSWDLSWPRAICCRATSTTYED